MGILNRMYEEKKNILHVGDTCIYKPTKDKIEIVEIYKLKPKEIKSVSPWDDFLKQGKKIDCVGWRNQDRVLQKGYVIYILGYNYVIERPMFSLKIFYEYFQRAYFEADNGNT